MAVVVDSDSDSDSDSESIGMAMRLPVCVCARARASRQRSPGPCIPPWETHGSDSAPTLGDSDSGLGSRRAAAGPGATRRAAVAASMLRVLTCQCRVSLLPVFVCVRARTRACSSDSDPDSESDSGLPVRIPLCWSQPPTRTPESDSPHAVPLPPQGHFGPPCKRQVHISFKTTIPV